MNKLIKQKDLNTDIDGRIPPQNLEIEVLVLGNLMQSRSSYIEATQIIDVDCFYKENHQLIFNAISEIEKTGNRADLLTVVQELKKNGDIETIGGIYVLTQMLNKASEVMELGQYCKILKELSMRRKLIWIGHKAANMGYSQETDVFEAYTEIGDMLSGELSFSSDAVFTIEDSVKGVYDQIERNCSNENKLTGIATGFSDFDKRSGGLQGSDLVIIAAETSQGKTSLATTIAYNASLNGARIAYYSLEMTKEQLAARIMSIETKIPANVLLYARLNENQIKHVHKNTERILETNIFFDERSTNNVDNILSSIRSLKIKYDINMVVVDYLQLVGSNKRGANREQQVADVARSLKNIAKELNINVILLSQLNRDVSSPYPKMSRLRDSGQVEECADIIMFIYRPEVYDKNYPKEFENFPTKGTALIDVAKGRNIGLLKFIVSFDAQATHFSEYDEDIPPTEKRNPFLD